MEWDSSVKRLDFEDVSLTIPQTALLAHATGGPRPQPQPQPSDGNDTLEVFGSPSAASAAADDGSFVSGLPNDCSIAELRQEAKRIRQGLASVDTFVTTFSHPFQQKVKAEAEGFDMSIKQLKKLFSTLETESIELTVKEGILKRLAEWKIGEETNDDESWLKTEIAVDSDTSGEELTALKNANSEIILEIESLIRTIASDVNGLETDLRNTAGCLDAFELEVDKRAEEEGALVCHDIDTNESLSVLHNQSENLQDLESTIRHLEETLRQNEKEYIEAEAAMESRIEQYNLEIEELQAQASQIDREEECMRLLIDVTSRFLQSRKHIESSSDVSVVSMENGNIELRLTTYVPNVDDPKDVPEQATDPSWEHSLFIKINQETMEIEEAKLAPESVPIDDLLSAAQEKRVTTASPESVKDGTLSEFGPQLVFLVRALHQRLTIHAFKVAAVSNASRNPRYSVEHTLESTVITVIKPGKFKASVEMPQNWPMQGFSLRLQSLQLLDPQSTGVATDDTMKMAVDVANKMPEYIRHDLLTFLQAIERITSE